VAQTDPFGLVGQVLDGQFRVDAYVGEGGFSIVYRGTHVGLSEPIAIKCLKLPAALGSALVESFVKRFRDESRLHYKLSQGNLHVVRSIASGTVISPATSALVPYTVLEWLEGRSLAEEFVDRRTRGLRGRPLVDAVRVLDSAIDAVAYAHAQGVVHRDLNPGNLFLAQTPSGVRLKVLDFGVAKIMHDASIAMGPTARTVGNVRMFAPAYGAPEQFDENVGAVGPWTDVYALALVLLETVTDRTAMEGQHLGEFALKAIDPANRPTPRALGLAVGDEVESVMAKATSLSPAQRPQDAGEMWGMLKHAMSVDAASGRAPHAVRAPSEPPPPNTLRMNTPVPEVPSPVVEVVRRPSGAPPGGYGASPTSPMAFTSTPSRANAGTLRMSQAPRSATEALAATPPPSPTATMRMATPPPPSPTSPYPDVPVPRAPMVPLASTPIPVSRGTAPPPILYPNSLGRDESRGRVGGGGAWLVVLVVVLLGAIAGGGWWIARRGHGSGPAPASSSGG
jgi:serine/threonine protein kinase